MLALDQWHVEVTALKLTPQTVCNTCRGAAKKTRGADRTTLRERLRPGATELGRRSGQERCPCQGRDAALEQCAPLLASLDDADRDRALVTLTARFGTACPDAGQIIHC